MANLYNYMKSASGFREIFIKSGYPQRTSYIVFVGAASSREHLISRLEAAPTGVTWTYRISTL